MGRILKASELVNQQTLEDEERSLKPTGEKRYCCIFCNDTKFHLYVNVEKNVYHCFKCEAKGKYLNDNSTTINTENLTLKNYLERKSIENKKIIKNLPRNKKITVHSPVYNYLVGRGLTAEEIRSHDLRASIDDKEVIIPVRADDVDDTCEYYVRRVITPVPGYSKYLNALWPKESALFLGGKKYSHSKVAVVCEGCFDAIRIGRCYPAYALLGKTATNEQVKMLAGFRFDILVIMLDPDVPISSLRLRADLMVAGMKHVVEARLNGRDPGSSNEIEIRRAVEDALLLVGNRSS